MIQGAKTLRMVFTGFSFGGATAALKDTAGQTTAAGADLAGASTGTRRFEETIRRTIDITVSLTVLLALLPLLIILAMAIKLESPGPVVYKQKRVGKNGRLFTCYKLRSMYADADQRLQALRDKNEASGPLFKIKLDPRITRVGRLIRRTSIDETPQLINILIGQMTLVGPRPALPSEVATYNDIQRQRLSVTPGLTGLWQVSGRSDIPFDQAIELDLDYIRRRSVLFDLHILARTFPAVLSGRGAY